MVRSLGSAGFWKDDSMRKKRGKQGNACQSRQGARQPCHAGRGKNRNKVTP